MSTPNEDGLEAAAKDGDINQLYRLIEKDPYILENIDSIPFVETPLHTAASFGQLHFAAEVMRLKPSFALKLNPQGFSPIYLAVKKGQTRMVLRFVEINKDLVRVKGREGLTPLHLASETGDVDLLATFLSACPESIEDVTVRNETALHIAVDCKKYESLQVLVGWLLRNGRKDATKLEKTILNWEDEKGNTILHISALNNDSQVSTQARTQAQVVLLLVETGMDLNAKNLENSTALDIAAAAANEEIKHILLEAGAISGSSVAGRASTLADKLASKITYKDRLVIRQSRRSSNISEEQRNAYLVVAALLVAATFQTVLSPPGGVYQANAGDNDHVNSNSNSNTTSFYSTATVTQLKAGTSVLSGLDFSILSVSSALSFLAASWTIFMLTPHGKIGAALISQVCLLGCNYCYSMRMISPTSSTSLAYYIYILFNIYLFYLLTTIFILVVHSALSYPEMVRFYRKLLNSYNMSLARLHNTN